VNASDPCPCSSGRLYGECCGALHAGEPASTAEALMRSRYSAFALRLAPYLLVSHHPSTRPDPATLDLGGTTWRRLQIVDTVAGGPDDAEGEVSFRASYRDDRGAGLVQERSRFVRHEGRWVYLDGTPL
jgi:SEC-C motif domain protein